MKFPEQKYILIKYAPDVIIETLLPYINGTRAQRIENVISGRLNSIQLAIEAPSDINNAFAAIRTAEALGVGKVHLISSEGSALTVRPITQGACYWVDILYHNSLQDFINYATQNKLHLAGGTLDATMPLSEVQVTQPLCILIGNEQRGLSLDAQTNCDYRYKIPMVGMSESMNLSVSAAISLYDTTQRKRQLLKRNGDLTLAEQQYTRAHYFLNSVAPRLAIHLLT